MSSARSIQRTLGIIKPDVSRQVETVVKRIRDTGKLSIVSRRDLDKWPREEAERFYAEHRGKFFYQRLIAFMTSGPMSVVVIEGENAIPEWRSLMGPTHMQNARKHAPDSIRAQIGTSDTRNAVHGSDAVETARKEIEFFFPDKNALPPQ